MIRHGILMARILLTALAAFLLTDAFPQEASKKADWLPAGNLFPSLRLDLRMQAPDKLFVTGMGLDSEWGANFELTGTSAAPRMTGQVRLVRGTLDFAGHSFGLQEGRITFTGGPI